MLRLLFGAYNFGGIYNVQEFGYQEHVIVVNVDLYVLSYVGSSDSCNYTMMICFYYYEPNSRLLLNHVVPKV